VDWDILRVKLEISDLGKKGKISWEIKSTRFFSIELFRF
jgi:hypothetical protein